MVAGSCSSGGSSASTGFADSLHAVCRTAAKASIDLDASNPNTYVSGAVKIVRGEIHGTDGLEAPSAEQDDFSDFSSNLDDQLRAFRKTASALSTGDTNSVGAEVKRLTKAIAAGVELADTLDQSRCKSIFDQSDIASLAAAMLVPPDVGVDVPVTTPDGGGATTTTVSGSNGTGASSIEWGPCAEQEAPWQCGTLLVPMDYENPGGAQIPLALNRLPAQKPTQRIGSLVINPGGPGGSGVQAAFGLAYVMPQDLLDDFDLVGFDPRGVGSSMPVMCDGDLFTDAAVLPRCIAQSGSYLSFLGTTSVARDLDSIRAAVGDQKLTYLGFSYGTAIGGVYADMFPENVRALVLDGDIDPASGAKNTTMDFDQTTYGSQDFDSTINFFLHLCDQSKECTLGPDSTTKLNALYKDVADLPVQYFTGGEPVTVAALDNLVIGSMYSIEQWSSLGIALGDAAKGDASTLAALISYEEHGFPATMNAQPDTTFAQVSVSCADFIDRRDNYECAGFPAPADPMPEITTAQGAPPMVVIGTKGDPATPYQFSAKMAAALGNTVELTWEGQGHTAFTESSCISDAATAYLVSLTVPAALDCPFIPGTSTDAERADLIFGHRAMTNEAAQIEAILQQEGETPEFAKCVSTKLAATNDHTIVVHELLGVDAPDVVALRDSIEQSCGAGG